MKVASLISARQTALTFGTVRPPVLSLFFAGPLQSFSMLNSLRRIPAQVALVALLFYLLTLSHGATFHSLPLTAKITGWDWLPMTGQPLFWLLTLPLRLLPESWIPTALNFFSALCAAATLAVLARSVELLLWPRTLAALSGWNSLLPRVLAATACGLEFSFWQNATAATGETLALLLLAAAIWCALEFRREKNFRWLHAAAFCWGLGLAENWAMQLTLPLFIAATIWTLKKKILKPKIPLALAGFGLAGFSVYALLPLANGMSPDSPWNWHAAWGNSFKATTGMLKMVMNGFWYSNRMITIALLLYFVLPLLAWRMRLQNEEAKNLAVLDQKLIWLFRGLRFALLPVCLWLMFDPVPGPRKLLAHQMGVDIPLVTFDYLNALGIGFLAGDLLLTFQPGGEARRRRRFGAQWKAWLERFTSPALNVLLAVVVSGLLIKNFSAIIATNRQPLAQIGDLLLRHLPPGGGIVVSDFPDKLDVLRASLAGHPEKSGWLPLDISMLPLPDYRAHWERHHPGHTLSEKNHEPLGPAEMFFLMERLMQSNRVFYIHPSFGYFFEVFHQQPAGLAFELKRLPANSFTPPLLPDELISQNEKMWDDLTPNLQALQHFGEPPASALAKSLTRHLYFEPVVPAQIKLLREWYSLALDDWGVQLQRNNRLVAAQKRFTQALDLNTNNLAARLNLFANAGLQSGAAMSLENAGRLVQEIGTMNNLKLILSIWGPMDEPSACYLLGFAYQQAGMPVQAIQQFERAHALAPDALASEFALAEIFGRYHHNERAAAAMEQLREKIIALPDPTNALTQLALLAERIRLAQTNGPHPDLLSPLAGQKNLPKWNVETNLLK